MADVRITVGVDMFFLIYFDLAIVTQHQLPFCELRQGVLIFGKEQLSFALQKLRFEKLAPLEFCPRHTVDRKILPSTCYL